MHIRIPIDPRPILSFCRCITQDSTPRVFRCCEGKGDTCSPLRRKSQALWRDFQRADQTGGGTFQGTGSARREGAKMHTTRADHHREVSRSTIFTVRVTTHHEVWLATTPRPTQSVSDRHLRNAFEPNLSQTYSIALSVTPTSCQSSH